MTSGLPQGRIRVFPGYAHCVTRTVLPTATILFALATIAMVAWTPGGETRSDAATLSEVEFAIDHANGDRSSAHFLVRSDSEPAAMSAALSTLGDLYPGATVSEVHHEGDDHGHDHDDTAFHAGDGGDGVSAQAQPWGWLWDVEGQPVQVAYNPDGAPSHFSVANVQYALELWSSVESSSFAFEYAGETTATASMNVSGRDDANVVAWQDLGCDEGCVLGLTTKSFDDHEVDISLNSHPGAKLGDGSNGTYDALTVFIHELGHMAGLEHSCPVLGPCTDDEFDAVMYYAYSSLQHTLGADDIEGITSLYPAPEGVTSSYPGVVADDEAGETPVPGTSDTGASSAVAVRVADGWNLAALPAGAIEDIADALTCVDAVYSYTPGEGWKRWIRGLYPELQTLTTLANEGDAYWVRASDSCSASFQ